MFSPDCTKSDDYKEITKNLYEYGQCLADYFDYNLKNNSQLKPLKSIFIKGFDNEQIWQQLEVFNRPFLKKMLVDVNKIITQKRPVTFNIDFNVKTDGLKDSTSILKTNSENVVVKKKKVRFGKKEIKEIKENDNNVVSNENFDFLDLNEMDLYLDSEDRKELEGDNPVENEEDEFIDYFGDDSGSDDDDDNVMYSDFFDLPISKEKVVNNLKDAELDDDEEVDDNDEQNDVLDTRDFDDEDMQELGDEDVGHSILDVASSDDDDELVNNTKDKYDLVNEKLRALANENLDEDFLNENKSEFEKSQFLLQKKIQNAERELLHPHNVHWQLSGETTGDVRPENSLLGEHLQYDQVTKPAPMITEDTTKTIEDLIKQRIKDKAFDDVVRKIKPNEQPFEFRRRILLDSEKSKAGLAEVYEKEYLKKQQQLSEQQDGANLSSFAAAGEVEENENRKDIRRMMRSLFRKLDALSSFHFTPKPPEPEIKIINNHPAINVEEVTPDTVSDMKLLAPEEVFSTRNKMVLQAKSERSDTDRKRARRIKKKKQATKQQFIQRKASLVNKAEIERLKKKIPPTVSNEGKKGLSSSTKFFQKLQESKEVTKLQRPKPKLSIDGSLSKKLKL